MVVSGGPEKLPIRWRAQNMRILTVLGDTLTMWASSSTDFFRPSVGAVIRCATFGLLQTFRAKELPVNEPAEDRAPRQIHRFAARG